MPIILNGLGLRFYRGIGEEIQHIGPFKDFNFFIGTNNSGKSTVLNFIHKHLPQSDKAIILDSIEQYRGRVAGKMEYQIGFDTEEVLSSTLKLLKDSTRNEWRELIKSIINFTSDNDLIWATKLENNKGFRFAKSDSIYELAKLANEYVWNNLWSYLTHRSGGSLNQHWIPEVLRKIESQITIKPITTHLIPAIREIGESGTKFDDYSGKGLIDRLAELQSPDHDKLDDRAKFDKINSFLQTVTGKYDARLDIPHNRKHILVHMDNKVLPLSSLGTGIHQVTMIAAFCTLSEGEIVCIEEPELHLHPLLQRKLIEYLISETYNQYFIATHSAAFIDTPDAAIFHVVNDSEHTYVQSASLTADRVRICRDLGYRASDIVQTNAIIWVEGPSDRIYINNWISTLAPQFIEGTHYSIMFYGGRLLSHLSANDEAVNEFIALRNLNHNLAIVIDSDKDDVNDSINETKLRLRDEFIKRSGVCWITHGREIENYIDHYELQVAVQKVYPKIYNKASKGGPFDHALEFYRNTPKKKKDGTEAKSLLEKEIDKVGVARFACDKPLNLDIFDLRQQIQKLVKMIETANL